MKILNILVLKSYPKFIDLLVSLLYISYFGRVKHISFYSFLTIMFCDGKLIIPFYLKSPAFLYQYNYHPLITTHLGWKVFLKLLFYFKILP
jgi:hypothetical protein